MAFSVEFGVSTKEEIRNYLTIRDNVLRMQNLQPPRTQITGIPCELDRRAGDLAVFKLGLGSGTLGTMYEGFDPVSGDSRVIKAFEIKNRKAGEVLEPELTINKRFGATPGLVRQYGWSTSERDLEMKVRIFPVQVYLVMEKDLDFSRHNWNKGGSELPTTRTKLCQDLLKGLAAIHTEGWMYRDITVQNILFIEATNQPPQVTRAALCDFGKLFFGRTDTSTVLAA